VPADRGEHVDELASLSEPELAILGGVPAEPPDGGAFVAQRVVVADQEDEAERVGEVDVAELSGGGEREVRVLGLEGALEPSLVVALRRHGRRIIADDTPRGPCQG
jgi:hypothetical protein